MNRKNVNKCFVFTDDVITELGCLLFRSRAWNYAEDLNTQPIHYLKTCLEDDTVCVILNKVTVIYPKIIPIFNIHLGKKISHNDFILIK